MVHVNTALTFSFSLSLLLFLLLLLLLPLYNITTHYSFLHYCFSSSSSSYDGDECYSTHGSHISTHDNESMLYSSREIEQSHHHPHPHDEHEHEDDSHTNTSNSNSSTTIQSLLNMENDPLQLIDFTVGGCNIWQGTWIPHHGKPAYTNATCDLIHEHQNCMANGRPDRTFLEWRWKPHDCELPLFDANKFLKLVEGKSMAFAGDSIARNHFQSLLCLLSQVEYPENIRIDDKFLIMRWYFRSYNFTLTVIWTPFLIKSLENKVEGAPVEKLHLDVVDEKWASNISDYDYLVLSAGHWFYRASLYFQNNEVIGCHYLQGTNVTELGLYFGLRTALRTVFDFLTSSNYHGLLMFRTFTPSHFENGLWHEGGTCTRTRPFWNATLDEIATNVYRIQLEEFAKTLNLGDENGVAHSRFKIVDTIHASILRPDGHPGPYKKANSSPRDLPQDCLHWCLPGPIDTWNAMLLEMLSSYSSS